MKKILLFVCAFILVERSFSQTLAVNGGWTSSLATTNIAEAGLNYPNGYLISAVNQTLMNVTSAANSVAFIYIQKSDTSWDSRLIMSARRTGTGTGSANFSTINSTTTQAVSNTPQYFFEVRPGSGTQVLNIPIQYLISGFTVLMPVKAYTTTLIYTISN